VRPEAVQALPFIAAALLAALVISYILTPVVIRVARRIGAMDEPDFYRRVHQEPVARAGGLAVAITFATVGLAAVWLTARFRLVPLGDVDGQTLAALLGGALVAAIIGFLDDRWQIRARWQFGGQVLLALVPVIAGVTIGFIYNPLAGRGASNFLLLASPLPAIVTVVWVVGMINSLNFIDGLDGLSSGIALIAALTLGVLSVAQGEPMVALLCAVLAGSLAGFMPWNFFPARVFTGTTGVMAVGYSLAILSIMLSRSTVALLVLGVPIIDTFWIIIRRLAHRQSPFRPDRGHLHHRLLDLGVSHRGAVLLIYAICVGLAVLSMVLSPVQQVYTFVALLLGGGVLVFVLPRRARADPREAASNVEIPPDVGVSRGGPAPSAGTSTTGRSSP
jgi:UDP-GlcNAc:undecaprenyl-phosphate GlcNAc-1-phosphate transferase